MLVIANVLTLLFVQEKAADAVILFLLLALPMLLALAGGALSRWLVLRKILRRPAAIARPSASTGLANTILVMQVTALPVAALIWHVGRIWVQVNSPWQGHAMLALAFVALLVAWSVCQRAWRRQTLTWPQTVLLTVSAVVLITAAGCVVLVKQVLTRAEQLAQGAPYCLQLPQADVDRRAASSLLDLSIFALAGRGSGHVELVIAAANEDQFMPWSFRELNFYRDSSRRFWCTPQLAYASKLSLAPVPDRAARPKYLRLALAGRALAIPLALHPQSHGENSVSFNALAPEFSPGDDGKRVEVRVVWACEQYASFHRGHCIWISGASPTYNRIEGVSEEFGLTKQSIEFVDAQSRISTGQRYDEYHQRDALGKIAVKITCHARSPDCEHLFDAQGLGYRFSHPRELLPRWREMQAKLQERLASFAVK